MLVEYVESRVGHGAVVMSAYFVESGLRMPDQQHHATHVGIFFVAAEKFQFAVTGNQDKRGRVFADMEKRGKAVDGGLQVGDALHLPVGEMTDHLSAKGYQPGQAVGIDVILGQPRFVKPQHRGEITASRVSGQENLAGAASVFAYFAESPGYGRRGIVYAGGNVDFGQQTVIDSHNHHALFAQFHGDVFASSCQSSSVEPDDHGTVCGVFRIVDIQFAAFTGVSVVGRCVRNVSRPLIGFLLGKKHCA